MGCEGSDKQYKDVPQWFDPLGPTGISGSGKNARQTFAPTGGVEQRDRIFQYLTKDSAGSRADSAELAARLKTAAGDSGWAAAQANARQTAQGAYLNGSPQLDAAMASVWQRQMADAANNEARMKGAYNRAGMGFSTANQQALQANRTAASAAAGQTEAATRLQNYITERGYQNAAPQMLEAAMSAPLNYLNAATTARLGPLMQEANLISGLASGGQIATPNSTIVRQPGLIDYSVAMAPDSI